MEYLKDPVRFADLFNGILFGGKQVIDAKYLSQKQRKKRLFLEAFPQEGSDAEKTQEEITQKKNDSESKIDCMERERDILMLYDKPEERCLFCCEGQSSADYTMPVRTLCYDGIEYADQLQTQEYKRKNADGTVLPLIPVYNQILYLGDSRWNSKHCLQELMQIPESLLKCRDLLPEYHIHIADIHEQDPKLFHTEWKTIFQVMKHSRKKEDLKAYVEEHKREINGLSLAGRLFLGALLDQYIVLESGKMEARDMCEAWNGAMLMYKDEGMREGWLKGQREGRLEGQREGEKAMARRIAENMYRRGYSLEDTVGLTGMPAKEVETWFKEF